MDIAFRSSSTASTSGTALTIAAPSGIVANDVLLAVIGLPALAALVTAPADWQLVNSATDAGTVAVWYKVATASEPANYTWTTASGSGISGLLVDYEYCDPAIPVTATSLLITSSYQNQSVTCPSITTIVANSVALAIMLATSATAFTTPAGWTARATINSSPSLWVGDQAFPAVDTATGDVSAYFWGYTDTIGMQIILQPPQATYAPPPWRGSAVGTAAATTTIAAALPTNIAANDVLLAQIVADQVVTISGPAGWSLVRSDANSGGSLTQAIFMRVATGSEGGSATWTVSAACNIGSYVVSYYGCDPTAPVGVNAGTTGSGTTQLTMPALDTTSANNTLAMFYLSPNNYPSSFTTNLSPRGLVPVVSGSSGTSWWGAADYPQFVSGRLSGTAPTVTLTFSHPYCVAALALQPVHITVSSQTQAATGVDVATGFVTTAPPDSSAASDQAGVQALLAPAPAPSVPVSLFPFAVVPSGVYETTSPGAGALARLDDIARRGFQYVLYLSANLGHLTDIENYLTRCAADGLQLILDVGEPAFWTSGQSPVTTYPTLASDLGASTLTQYLTNLVNALTGYSALAGYYLADDPPAPAHAAVKSNATLIASLDATRPRLVMAAGVPAPTGSYAAWLSTWTDCCDILGVDYYGYQYAQPGYDPTLTAGVGAQLASTCRSASLQATVGLQAFPWSAYGGAGAYPPASVQRVQRDMALLALGDVTTPFVLWRSYNDSVTAGLAAQLRDVALPVWGVDTQ